MVFCSLEAMLNNRLCRKSINKKKNGGKGLVQDTSYQLSYEEFHCKTTQISEENELYPEK